MKLWYDPHQVEVEVQRALSTLAAEYPISAGPWAGATGVEFERVETPGALDVTAGGGAARIRYGGLAQACRGVGSLLGAPEGDATRLSERTGFETLGLMLDCSRNAVLRVDQVQKWLRRMALSGYNAVMLYTEDTYQLPGEPLFGFLRGAYTLDEVRELDAYAATLGIELIGCIQTLGHLEQILKWRRGYASVRDTSSVMLAEEPQTYALIEKMVHFWERAVRSRRIHIGQDETHDLGRGRYMDLHGYRRGFDIFNNHLAQVVRICEAQGLQPMIWSDMYFRMGSRTGDYYDAECVIPPEVAAAIPKDVQLVYWDYYHPDEAFYRDWIVRHRALGFEPPVFSGIWTWGRLVYSHERTRQTVLPCVRACLEEGVRELFFTMWKDDGAEVDFDSSLAGVVYAAEASYNGGEVDDARWAARFAGVCLADLAANLAITELDLCPDVNRGEVNSRMLLWEDPLLALYSRSLAAQPQFADFHAAQYYRELARKLADQHDSGAAGDLAFARQLAHTLALKAEFCDELRALAGPDGAPSDCAALKRLADERIPQLAAALRELWEVHRRVWMAQNKPFGFEVVCVRYGGLLLRLEEIALRIRQYLGGQVERIDELAQPFEPLAERFGSYHSVATVSSIL